MNLQRLFSIICGLALAAALCGCTAVKFGYNALDDVGLWWLDGYLDFDDTQESRVREDLDRLQAWHRANELPKVAEILGRMERLVTGSITPVLACAFVPEFQARLGAVADQAQSALATTALTLTPGQLRHLERKYEKTNAKWRKDWIALTPAELKEKRFEQTLDRLEMVYGRLGPAQRDVLQASLEQSTFDAQRVFAERQRRQNDLLQVLRKLTGSQANDTEARAALRAYIDRVTQSPNPGYRAYQQAQLDENCRMVSAVHEATTPAQREHAARKLRGWQRDLRELSQERS